jgi:hypothetical protein
MSTAKYTPAPQEDPDAHLNYTQPPPSYQAESSSAQDQDRLFGAPRSSEDNIPDDFKVRWLFALESHHDLRLSIAALPLPRRCTRIANFFTVVWRFCRRSDRRNSEPIHPQGLHHPDGAARRHRRSERRQLLERQL